jgi:hypothetical protein
MVGYGRAKAGKKSRAGCLGLSPFRNRTGAGSAVSVGSAPQFGSQQGRLRPKPSKSPRSGMEWIPLLLRRARRVGLGAANTTSSPSWPRTSRDARLVHRNDRGAVCPAHRRPCEGGSTCSREPRTVLSGRKKQGGSLRTRLRFRVVTNSDGGVSGLVRSGMPHRSNIAG